MGGLGPIFERILVCVREKKERERERRKREREKRVGEKKREGEVSEDFLI